MFEWWIGEGEVRRQLLGTGNRIEHGIFGELKKGEFGTNKKSGARWGWRWHSTFASKKVIGYHMEKKIMEKGKRLSARLVRRHLQYRAKMMVANLFLYLCFDNSFFSLGTQKGYFPFIPFCIAVVHFILAFLFFVVFFYHQTFFVFSPFFFLK